MSSNPVTAVLHHNREEWTYVDGYENNYEEAGSFDGQVGITFRIGWELTFSYQPRLFNSL